MPNLCNLINPKPVNMLTYGYLIANFMLFVAPGVAAVPVLVGHAG